MKSCPRCGFYNTDDRERCLKCKAILEHDWRAAQHKVKERRVPTHRLTAAVADTFQGARRLFVFDLPEQCPHRYPWRAGFLGLLPGLGQVYNRQYRKALLFFAVFAAAVWLAVATVHHPTSYVFIAGLVCWVLYSFNDAMITATRIDGQEWRRAYTIASFSALFFYLGVFWSLSQFFLVGIFFGIILYCVYSLFWPGGAVSRNKVIVTLGVTFGILLLTCYLAGSGNPVIHRWVYWSQNGTAPVLKKGDYVYVDCFSYWFRKPRLGELIYYNPRSFSIQVGQDLYLINMANTVERLVALPGDRFERRKGQFLRNGEPVPPEYQPINPAGLHSDFAFDVPAGRYLLLISYGAEDKTAGLRGGSTRTPAPRDGVSPEWAAACLVTRHEIMGRCLFIWHPVARRRWLVPPEPRG